MKICMKEDNPGPNYFKEDNSREIVSSVGGYILFVIWLTVLGLIIEDIR